ncbi:Protein of unknown function [Gryllus bimaculatus]|nr:Protein of unknown function [Gryllus bimaculatus]
MACASLRLRYSMNATAPYATNTSRILIRGPVDISPPRCSPAAAVRVTACAATEVTVRAARSCAAEGAAAPARGRKRTDAAPSASRKALREKRPSQSPASSHTKGAGRSVEKAINVMPYDGTVKGIVDAIYKGANFKCTH